MIHRIKILLIIILFFLIIMITTKYFFSAKSKSSETEHFLNNPSDFDKVLDSYCVSNTGYDDYVWNSNICEYKQCANETCYNLVFDRSINHNKIYKYDQYPVPMQRQNHKCTPGLNNNPESNIYCLGNIKTCSEEGLTYYEFQRDNDNSSYGQYKQVNYKQYLNSNNECMWYNEDGVSFKPQIDMPDCFPPDCYTVSPAVCSKNIYEYNKQLKDCVDGGARVFKYKKINDNNIRCEIHTDCETCPNIGDVINCSDDFDSTTRVYNNTVYTKRKHNGECDYFNTKDEKLNQSKCMLNIDERTDILPTVKKCFIRDNDNDNILNLVDFHPRYDINGVGTEYYNEVKKMVHSECQDPCPNGTIVKDNDKYKCINNSNNCPDYSNDCYQLLENNNNIYRVSNKEYQHPNMYNVSYNNPILPNIPVISDVCLSVNCEVDKNTLCEKNNNKTFNENSNEMGNEGQCVADCDGTPIKKLVKNGNYHYKEVTFTNVVNPGNLDKCTWSNSERFVYNSNNPFTCEDIGATINADSNCICTSDVYFKKNSNEYHKLSNQTDKVKYPGFNDNIYQKKSDGFNYCDSLKTNYFTDPPPVKYVEVGSSGVYKVCENHTGNDDPHATYENNEEGTSCTKNCNSSFEEGTDGKCKCPPGKYLSANSCVPCEPGTYKSIADLSNKCIAKTKNCSYPYTLKYNDSKVLDDSVCETDCDRTDNNICWNIDEDILHTNRIYKRPSLSEYVMYDGNNIIMFKKNDSGNNYSRLNYNSIYNDNDNDLNVNGLNYLLTNNNETILIEKSTFENEYENMNIENISNDDDSWVDWHLNPIHNQKKYTVSAGFRDDVSFKFSQNKLSITTTEDNPKTYNTYISNKSSDVILVNATEFYVFSYRNIQEVPYTCPQNSQQNYGNINLDVNEDNLSCTAKCKDGSTSVDFVGTDDDVGVYKDTGIDIGYYKIKCCPNIKPPYTEFITNSSTSANSEYFKDLQGNNCKVKCQSGYVPIGNGDGLYTNNSYNLKCCPNNKPDNTEFVENVNSECRVQCSDRYNLVGDGTGLYNDNTRTYDIKCCPNNKPDNTEFDESDSGCKVKCIEDGYNMRHIKSSGDGVYNISDEVYNIECPIIVASILRNGFVYKFQNKTDDFQDDYYIWKLSDTDMSYHLYSINNDPDLISDGRTIRYTGTPYKKVYIVSQFEFSYLEDMTFDIVNLDSEPIIPKTSVTVKVETGLPQKYSIQNTGIYIKSISLGSFVFGPNESKFYIDQSNNLRSIITKNNYQIVNGTIVSKTLYNIILNQIYIYNKIKSGNVYIDRSNTINNVEKSHIISYVDGNGRILLHLAPSGKASCDYGDPVTSEEQCRIIGKNFEFMENENTCVLESGTNACRGLQIRTQDNCANDEAWGRIPLGCSVQTGGDWAAHLRRGNVTCNDNNVNRNYQLVCSGPPGANTGVTTINKGVTTISKSISNDFSSISRMFRSMR